MVDEVAEQLALRPQLARRSSAAPLPAGYLPQQPSEPHGHHNGLPATSTPAHPAAGSPASMSAGYHPPGGVAVEGGGHAGRGVISSGGHGSGSGAALGSDASGVAGYPPSRAVDGYPPSRQVAIAPWPSPWPSPWP